MNCLWPAGPRFSPRSLFSSCRQVESLAVRLAQRSISSQSKLGFQRSSTGGFPTVSCIARPLVSKPWNGTGRRAFATSRIITKFEDIPDNYKDAEGLAFRTTPLQEEELLAIFGKGIDVNAANRMLSVLHGRRVAGTLAEPDVPESANVYEERARQLGLAWLRENVSVDEIRSAGINAEFQLEAMDAELVADAQRLGLYKPNHGGDLHGKGVFQTIREHNEKVQAEKDAEKAKELSQADEIRYNTGTLEVRKPASKVELRRPGENPKLKYYLERAKVLPNTPPEMTMFQRLWPSGLFVAAVVLGCLVFAQVYRPPKRSDRLMAEIPPAAATFVGVFLINLLIFGMWHHPPAFRLLNKYFVTTPGYPRPLSLIGNIFSHQTFSHLAVNMLVLYFVGTRFHDEVGRGNFLAIYLACGALGSFASLTSWVVKGNFISSSLGASGALAGIIAAYLWLNSTEAVTFFGVFPPDAWPVIPSAAFLALMIGSDVYCLTKWNRAPITLDHWAHLGGYAAGIGAAELLKMKARRRRVMEKERGGNEGWVEGLRRTGF